MLRSGDAVPRDAASVAGRRVPRSATLDADKQEPALRKLRADKAAPKCEISVAAGGEPDCIWPEGEGVDPVRSMFRGSNKLPILKKSLAGVVGSKRSAP